MWGQSEFLNYVGQSKVIQPNIEFQDSLSSGSHADTLEHTDRGTMDMMKGTGTVCDYGNVPKNQT